MGFRVWGLGLGMCKQASNKKDSQVSRHAVVLKPSLLLRVAQGQNGTWGFPGRRIASKAPQNPTLYRFSTMLATFTACRSRQEEPGNPNPGNPNPEPENLCRTYGRFLTGWQKVYLGTLCTDQDPHDQKRPNNRTILEARPSKSSQDSIMMRPNLTLP